MLSEPPVGLLLPTLGSPERFIVTVEVPELIIEPLAMRLSELPKKVRFRFLRSRLPAELEIVPTPGAPNTRGLPEIVPVPILFRVGVSRTTALLPVTVTPLFTVTVWFCPDA